MFDFVWFVVGYYFGLIVDCYMICKNVILFEIFELLLCLEDVDFGVCCLVLIELVDLELLEVLLLLIVVLCGDFDFGVCGEVVCLLEVWEEDVVVDVFCVVLVDLVLVVVDVVV